jgi:hypothetical protein
MNTKKILGYALLHALAAVAYVAGVATIMNGFGGAIEEKNEILAPVVFLLLFSVSAAIMGMIVFARPILWYLDGLKKEAVQLVIGTISFLALICMGIVAALLSGVV